MSDPQWYAVSFGDGNDGVSHLVPNYYVKSDDPWLLARAAMIDAIVPRHQRWAEDTVEVDGEAEHTVTAMLSEGPGGETAFGAAWMICEVWPIGELTKLVNAYDSIEAALSPEAVTLAREADTPA